MKVKGLSRKSKKWEWRKNKKVTTKSCLSFIVKKAPTKRDKKLVESEKSLKNPPNPMKVVEKASPRSSKSEPGA